MKTLIICPILFLLISVSALAQHSVAREWNEVLLEAIRNDFARPTVHARNLFHISGAMYDAWAVYEGNSTSYFLGKIVDGFTIPFDGISSSGDLQSNQEEAISFAAYRLLKHRFEFSPGADVSTPLFDSLMVEFGYDTSIVSTEYSTGSPAMLGNYIAAKIIDFGLQDGSNEQFGYGNLFYQPVNRYNFNALDPVFPGNPNLVDPNRWQPLRFGSFIDQSGNPIPTEVPTFLGAEWGQVSPFSLSDEDLTIYNRKNFDYLVYHDPGAPPFIDTTGVDPSEHYKWTFSLVSVWSSHLDPKDGVMWDISPASIGNSSSFPISFDEYQQYYNMIDGGDSSQGWDMNPVTKQPYKPQIVPRADYARVLAEFWADGPDSETPPGHWFTILNYVNDHPELEKRYRGQSKILGNLEWDIKSYLMLGGAMHDAAIAAWGVKGWYDYIRPISALRYMTDLGQSSDPELPNYHPAGIPLIDGYIELIEEGDSLVSVRDSVELIGTIKLKAWKGHFSIENPDTSSAGVGWIPAGEWWSYQRPTFVTPPFAGYVSGHSTFSRAAAEVMTFLTGSEFFPGGMGEFEAKKNEFLVFEEGPSVDVTLQWATYQDASDQTSLSRIWGGIHPPADDIPGRIIGIEVAKNATTLADKLFDNELVTIRPEVATYDNANMDVYPNPVQRGVPLKIQLSRLSPDLEITVYNILGQKVISQRVGNHRFFQLNTSSLSSGIYLIRTKGLKIDITQKIMVIK